MELETLKKQRREDMTTGQLIFYSGLALLCLTVLTAIVFIVKRPKYRPENAVYESAEAGQTQRLRNGYPTERQTIRRDKSAEVPEPTELIKTGKQETAGFFQVEQTEILPPTEK